MFGLPKETEIGTQLPKKAIFAKFDIKPDRRNSFDADISKLVISNELNANRLPIEEGCDIKSIFIVALTLKRKEYDANNIILLAKTIPQKIIFALIFDDEVRLAAFHTRLIVSKWGKTNDVKLAIKGNDLDRAWENFIIEIGSINVKNGNTLEKQIADDIEREKLLKLITVLERKARNEIQPARKLEMFEEIKRLKHILR